MRSGVQIGMGCGQPARRAWVNTQPLQCAQDEQSHQMHGFAGYIPHLSAMSWALIPQIPCFNTSTRSPGSTTFTIAASIPACPVPLTAIVSVLVVWKAYCKPALISSMISRHSGWRWPTSGRDAAFRMRGGQLEGPGPHSSRSGTVIGFRSLAGGL